MNYEDLFNRLLILRSPNIGPVRYNDLIKKSGGIKEAIAELCPDDSIRGAVSREIDLANQLHIHYISDDMDEYPDMLRRVSPHPPIISVRGKIETLSKPCVSIVGTRHATAVGMNFVSDIANAFSMHGYTVVSGLAMGTDTAAHKGALKANGNSQTIAVMAGGVDYVWPLENESLYWEIIERGAIISEMPVGFKPVASNFVMRNRWIAGIGQKLILGEADLKSGSMKTAQFAIESNREIWAIPSHPLDSRAAGPNSLIKSGIAKMCTGVSDFFKQEKKLQQGEKISKKTDSENSILDAIGTIPVSESVLSEIVKKSISEIKSELVVLELQGLVRKVDGGYVRT